MPSKRFSVADAEAKGSFTKRMRSEQGGGGPTLVAVARPWGSAFWVFEGRGRSFGGGRIAHVHLSS